MRRDKLIKKQYRSKHHDYELHETMDVTDDTGRHPDIAFIYSGRERGKSYEVAMQLIMDAWYDDKTFMYVRRHDATNFQIESYFNDKIELVQDMTDGQADGIMCKQGQLYLYHNEDNNGKIKREIVKRIGYYIPLSGQGNHKSEQFPDCYNLLFEEVLTNDPYLSAEPERLYNLISTVSRSKPGFKSILVSNLVSYVNPYSKAWGIGFSKTKPGEIGLTKLYLSKYDDEGKEKYWLVAAHYLVDKNQISKEDAAKKVNRVKAGSDNRWEETRLYTTIDLSYIRTYTPLETVIFEWDDVMMQGDILEVPVNIRNCYIYGDDPSDQTMPILYIRKKTSEPFKTTRVYTNNSERFSEYTSRGFKKIYKVDQIIEVIMMRGWYMGADNLTMNAFDTIYKKLKLFN